MSTLKKIAPAIRTEQRQAVNIAHAMVDDAERAAEAKAEAAQHSDCRSCQAGMENYLLKHPQASFTDKENAHRDIWEHCHDCQVEYGEWLAECHQRINADLLDGHAHNGDDIRWQNGGAK